MITFTLCLLALIVGYFTYGRLMERVFGPDDRKTPALTKADGVDYIPLPTWKIFMIQFLNICGLCWGVSLRVLSMIILPECFLCAMVVKVCPKS